ncbi:hypothetical protein ZYGR_0BA00740 [Zygosaccharomyces rouxii]|uniref:Protein transport protein SEC23 n=1 Tax=Zygosaccharomyces rouxii TaxID=4956 RepID=A0A1Q3AK96_ZYGRO|nr:hypothetical protein ZYGR_0BA00740 [Zygosaccharomyces rouxii]
MSWFNYGVLPASRNEALQNVGDEGHIHCLYEPFKAQAEPLEGQFRCEKCKGFYGGSRIVDSDDKKKWICIFCDAYNPWHPDMPDCETYVSQTGGGKSQDNVLVIVIDTICDKEELHALQSALRLKPNTKYSLVTLHRNGDVAVHSPDMKRSFSAKHHKIEHYLKRLNHEYFIKHLDQGLFDSVSVMGAINRLEAKNSHSGKRGKRSTGLALFLASILGDEVVCFLSGPCTESLGKVASREKKNTMRQQHDLDKSAKYFDDARQFYSKMKSAASFTIFASSLDQIGFMEMSDVFNSAAQFDSFKDERFVHTLDKFLDKRSSAISNLRLTVVSSGRLLVDGALTRASSAKPTLNNYSDTSRGEGRSNTWTLESPYLDPENLVVPLSLSIVTGATIRDANENVPEQLYMQFQLEYTQNGASFAHVHTKIIPTSNSPNCLVVNSFNPKIELVYLMKSISYQVLKGKFTTDQLQRIRYQLDTVAIAKHESQDFLKFYYGLRRTPLFTTRNVSPDQRVLFLHQINRSSIETSLCYALPSVVQFQSGNKILPFPSQDLLSDPTPTVMDGGYFVGVRYAQKDIEDVEAAKEAAKLIMSSRFPEPLYIDTVIGGSQDRFFKSKLIPVDDEGARILETQDIPFVNFVGLVEKRSKGE